MYKLVIVDDERDVRRRIAALVRSAESSFSLVAEYENGIDAYDGILTDNPDLVITDIRIPYIDGIELSKKIREVLPLVKIIIITGYDEFDYAKEAANLGVIGFISKPVTLLDVREALEKAEQQIAREYMTEQNLTQLREFYADSLPVIREANLIRLSNMTAVTPQFEERLRYNDIRLDYRYYAMCVFDFDEAAEDAAERYELAFTYIRKYMEEDRKQQYDADSFSRYEKLCLILKSNEPFFPSEIEQGLETTILRAGRYAGTQLSVGVSSVFEEKNFARMLDEAQHALEYRSVMGGGKVFFFGGVAAGAGAALAVDDNAVKELGYLLRYKPLAECRAALGAIKAQLQGGEHARNSYFYVLTSILNALLRACENLDGLYRHFSGHNAMYRRLFETKTAEESFAFLEEVALAVHTLNNEAIVDTVEQNLQRILAYLEAHYCDPDISFLSLSNGVNLSVSYISALLKKNLNTTFVKQLTTLRMERAKELLQNPSLKIIDVAEQLGYLDPYYFSHCFKKYTGMSPKGYRSHE